MKSVKIEVYNFNNNKDSLLMDVSVSKFGGTATWTTSISGKEAKYLVKNQNFFEKFITHYENKNSTVMLHNLFTYYPVCSYVSNLDTKTKEKILEYLPTLNENQLGLFVHVLEYNSKLNKKHNVLLDLERIKGGLFNKKIYIHSSETPCADTMCGFYSSMDSGTFNYADIMVDGKLVKVLIKSSKTTKFANKRLAIDPKTMSLYSLKSGENGKFTNVTLIYQGSSFLAKESTFKDKLDYLVSKKYSKENLAKIKENMQRIVAEKRKARLISPKPRNVRV